MINGESGKRSKTITTIPLYYYILIIIAGVVLVFCRFIVNCNSGCLEGFVNIGCGIISSTTVALLVDIMNTTIERNRQESHFDELVFEYQCAFLKVRDSVLEIAEDRTINDDQKRSFAQWIDYAVVRDAYDDSDEDYESSLLSLVFALEAIKKTSIQLEHMLQFHLDNVKNTRDYRWHLKRVHTLSKHIISSIDDKKYDDAINCVKDKLLPLFLRYNSNYIEYFEEPYSEDHWYIEM